jgi:16S rRNA (uracil1498-N3)-methyltransferase
MIDVFPKDRAMIVCAELGDATAIHAALQSPALQKFAKAAVVTGPEGGFATEEFALLHKSPNAHFVRLGPRILRADTAAIAALTCWQAVQGDWKSIG